jgi:glycosyltransferase involved in cell wall biosynthesis
MVTVLENLDLVMQNGVMNNLNPFVVVWMVAYNQEKYVDKAVESIMMQQTNFEYLLIIGEDCSTDNTRKLCEIQKEKYGNKIQLLLNEKNLGSMDNALNVYEKCFQSNAKYIALCEGDDYWTDPHKLQKQVDFLETHPDYAICFHAVNILEDGKLRPSELNWSDKEATYSILDLANSNLMHTPSVVFRNGLIDKFPEWYQESPVGDYVLHLLNAKKGLIKYLPEVMAVYRVHEGGTWSQRRMDEVYLRSIALLDLLMKEDFEAKVIEVFKSQKTRRIREFTRWLLTNNKYQELHDFINKYKNKPGDVIDITDSVIQHLKKIETDLKIIKGSKTFSLAKKIAHLNPKRKFI